MSTITITINASQADFSTFADELGYMTNITLPNLSVIPNPESKQVFLENYFKNITIGELYRRKAQAIDQVTIDAKLAEKAALKAGITSAVGVTSVL